MIFYWVKDFLLHHCCCLRFPLHQLQNLIHHLINHGSPVIIIPKRGSIKCQSSVRLLSNEHRLGLQRYNFSWHDTYLNTNVIKNLFPLSWVFSLWLMNSSERAWTRVGSQKTLNSECFFFCFTKNHNIIMVISWYLVDINIHIITLALIEMSTKCQQRCWLSFCWGLIKSINLPMPLVYMICDFCLYSRHTKHDVDLLLKRQNKHFWH